MQIKDYKPINRGVVVCSFTIVCDKWQNFEIRGCTLFESNGKRWISLPSREYEKDGKKKYWPYVSFPDREKNDKFLAAIMATLDQHVLAMAPNNATMAAAKVQGMSDDDLPF